MPRKRKVKRRSECPLNASVEMLGDRWSLLIIRDMMLRGFCSYKEFLQCYEGIATNILGDRLHKLVSYGILTSEPDPLDGRKLIYSLTAKGIDLAPVADAPAKRGFAALNSAFHDNDIMMRVAGDTLALTPPLIVSEDQIGEIIEKTAKVIRATA